MSLFSTYTKKSDFMPIFREIAEMALNRGKKRTRCARARTYSRDKLLESAQAVGVEGRSLKLQHAVCSERCKLPLETPNPPSYTILHKCRNCQWLVRSNRSEALAQRSE